MALIIILVPFIALAVLSLLWGYDSRETSRSKEEELASYGMTWPDTLASEQELANELAAALERLHSRPGRLAA